MADENPTPLPLPNETYEMPEAPESPPPHRPRRRNPLVEFYRHNIRPHFSQRLSRLAAVLVPQIYMAYMRLVWATSRIEGAREFGALQKMADENKGAVALLWHEEVMTVAYGYYYLGLRGHTLASVGASGELIARMLALCNFVVFRGGSTTHQSRRREGILRDMIVHMNSRDDVIFGLTVDGSKGPPYRMKSGGIIIARECGRPIALVRTWYKRCLRLPTWDRMALPLPFNVLRYYILGPYTVPASANTEAGLEEFRLTLECDLIDLAARSYDDMGHRRPRNLIKDPLA